MSDVDNAGSATDDLDFTIAGTSVYGSLSLNTETGAWTYTLNDSDTDTDGLAAGVDRVALERTALHWRSGPGTLLAPT